MTIVKGGKGAEILNLTDLADVTISTPSNTQVLTYEAASSEWKNKVLSETIALTGLTDVTISSAADNDLLQYNASSGEWENQTLATVADGRYLQTATANLTLPTITGQSGKYLTTNGTTLSWNVITELLAHGDLSDMPDIGGTNTDHDVRYPNKTGTDTVSGIWDFTAHPTGLDHTQISNIGTNNHSTIDSHIADGTKHFTMPALDDLTDINAPIPSDNDSLTWDVATSRWIPEAIAATYARAATLVVVADDSNDTTNADYFCDGVADEVQINQALNDLPATGGCVCLMEGTYNIAATITTTKARCTLSGQGAGTILTTSSAIKIVTLVHDETLIENIKFVGPDRLTTATYGIYTNTGPYRCTIRGCWFDTMLVGISIQYIREPIVEANHFNNCGYALTTTSSTNYVVITCNTFLNCYKGITLAANFGLVTGNQIFSGSGDIHGIAVSGTNNVVMGNNVRGGDGIKNTGRSCKIISNSVSYGDDGIWVSGADYCDVIGNAVEVCEKGINLTSGANNNTISSNTVYNSVSNDGGIYVNASHHNTITGNTLTKIDRHGIELVAANHNIITGNNIHDCSEDSNNSYDGIHLRGTSTYNVVENNRVSADAANKHRYSIREAAAADDWNNVTGNTCTDAATANISLQGANDEEAHNIT